MVINLTSIAGRFRVYPVKRVLISALVVIVIGAAIWGVLAYVVPLPSGEDDVAEAVFRYQFQQNGYTAKDGLKVYCLLINNQDPSDSFLQRFKDVGVAVKKGSACTTFTESPLVKDRVTAERGVIFNVNSRRGNLAGGVEVEGSSASGNVGGAGFVFRLTQENNRWQVKDSTMRWIA